MDNPELYAETNYNQYKDVKDLIREYQNEFTWNENEKILDIGCGPGNVTSELLLPIIPKSSYLLGVDVSNEMINFAQKKYKDGRLGFTTLDIEADNVTEVLGEENFDKIFSFYCLHWVHDYRKVAENLWKLMKPNGYALLVFLQSSSLYSMYEWLSTQPKWKEYMLDVNNFISVYQKTNNPSEKYRNLLENVGFKVIHCYVKEASVSLPTCEAFKKTMKALNPFINRMPNDLHDEYLDCIMKTAVNKGFIKVDSTKDYEILSDITPNKLLITFCQKIV